MRKRARGVFSVMALTLACGVAGYPVLQASENESAFRTGISYDRVSRTVTWDGKNGTGEDVAAGFYFCDLRAGGERQIRKIVLVR